MRAASTAFAVTLATVATALFSATAADLRVKVVDRSGVPLANAVVYAVPAVPIPPAKPLTAVIDQVHRRFVPHVSVVQTGTAIEFPNSDNIRHSVYSFSPTKTFVLKLYAGRAAPPVVFDKAGIVALGCEIHDSMIAWLLVVNTPYYAKSDAQGLVTLSSLRAGDYLLYGWHEPMRQSSAQQPLHVPQRAQLPAITIRVDTDTVPMQAPPMSGMPGMSN